MDTPGQQRVASLSLAQTVWSKDPTALQLPQGLVRHTCSKDTRVQQLQR